MLRFRNEFLVGLLTIAVAATVVWGIIRTDDMADAGSTDSYQLVAYVPSAEGLYRSSPVRIAGVRVGSVDTIQLEGGRARLTLRMLGDTELPADSVAELRSDGLLGDQFLRVTPGQDSTLLRDGDTIKVAEPGADLTAMTNKASAIADDVKVLTASLRAVAEDPATRARLDSTLANVEALSHDLRVLAGASQGELEAITRSLREVTDTLNRVIGRTGESVDTEMAAVAKATATLDETLEKVKSIVDKVDRGEGTIGQLVNDTTTIDSVNATLDKVNGVIGGVSQIRTQVYYRGDVFFGTDPSDGAYTNPTHLQARNVVGARILPREDYGYVFEIVSHPLGTIDMESRTIPEFGTSYTEYVVRPDYRFSFMFLKRVHDFSFRFGVKESSGGVGVDWMLFDDRVALSADVYDFLYGSWPIMDGTPNVQLTLRATPFRNVYVEGGLDNVALGLRHGYVTGFVGGGFTFNDEDLKFVLAALPVSP